MYGHTGFDENKRHSKCVPWTPWVYARLGRGVRSRAYGGRGRGRGGRSKVDACDGGTAQRAPPQWARLLRLLGGTVGTQQQY